VPKLFAPPWAVPLTRTLKLEPAVAENDHMVFTDAAWLILKVHSAYEPAWPFRTTYVPETVAPEEAVTSEPGMNRLPFDTVAREPSSVPAAKSMLQPDKKIAIDTMVNSTRKTVFLFTLILLFVSFFWGGRIFSFRLSLFLSSWRHFRQNKAFPPVS